MANQDAARRKVGDAVVGFAEFLINPDQARQQAFADQYMGQVGATVVAGLTAAVNGGDLARARVLRNLRADLWLQEADHVDHAAVVADLVLSQASTGATAVFQKTMKTQTPLPVLSTVAHHFLEDYAQTCGLSRDEALTAVLRGVVAFGRQLQR